MRVAVIGSRNLHVDDLSTYIPKEVTEIVSGGAKGIDTCARQYAIKNGIKIREFLPKYNIHGRSAPLRRNIEIVDNSDVVVAFWDGVSRGTKHTIDYATRIGKKVTMCILDK